MQISCKNAKKRNGSTTVWRHRPSIQLTLVALPLVVATAGGCYSPAGSSNQKRLDSTGSDHRKAPSTVVKLEKPTGPDKAMRWRQLRWQDETGRVPPTAWRDAYIEREANAQFWAQQAEGGVAGLQPADWLERGPNNVGGRTRSLLIHPTQTNRMWAGSVSGGLWYSSDSGASWAPVNDFWPNLSVCSLTFDPVNPDIMYAGTGEGFFNLDAIGGAGIFKSTDGGVNWVQLPNTSGWDTVNRIAISPTNSNIILAAKRYGGIQRSIDAGQTWSNPLWGQGSFYVAFHPTDGNKAVGHIIDYDFGIGDWFHRAVYSTNGGVSWNTAAGLSAVYGFGSRIEPAYSPSAPNNVYASVATNGGKIWKSTDGGQSYSLVTTSGSSGVSWYANPLWVEPLHDNFLVTGGYHIYRSTNSGVSLQQISNGYIMTTQPHPDIHFIVHDPGFNATTNRKAYACTDGGVWKTNDIFNASTASGWSRIEQSYRTTQFYGAAGDGASGVIIGGTQDNGTLRVPTGSQTASLMFGGDGGFCAVDPTDANYCYGEYVNLQIHRSTNGGISSSYIYGGIADADVAANFIAPFILDPNNPNTMLAGGSSLWRSTNVKATTPNWSAIRAPGSDLISAIAVAPGNSNIIWVGQNNGELFRTTNGTAANPLWVAMDNNAAPDPLPDRYVTRIVVDPGNSNIVYVSFGGFNGDNLWRSTNGGTLWQDVTGSGVTGLPSAPIYGVARHPDDANSLFVGTEVGIFSTTNGGTTWATSNQGPANVSVDEVIFMNNSRTLLAATHGRGLWTATICASGSSAVCDDGNPCTADSCNTLTGCAHVAAPGPCNDGNACTTNDTCSGTVCVGGSPLVCQDGNVCTNDSCNPATGCVYVNNSATCDDGDECTTNDICNGGVCGGTYTPKYFGDIAPPGGNGVINIDDILCVIGGFALLSTCPDGDQFPCGGNNTISLDDILVELNAFAGGQACPHPCPP